MSGGRRIHVVLRGAGSPRVIFDSGAGVGAAHWSRVQAGVAEHTATFAYDRAGQGASDPLPGQWTLQQLADDLDAAVRAVSLPGPYLVVGHSFGGHVVRTFAARHPEAVLGMALVDARPTRIDEMCPAWRDWARAQDADPALDQAVDEANQQVDALPDLGHLPLTVLSHGISDMIDPASLAAEVSDEFEAAWQSLQREHARMSTVGRLVVAEHSGHMIADTEPELITSTVLDIVTPVREPNRWA
jgi:pimeloyl-ACP methyl ester carboxylesterase